MRKRKYGNEVYNFLLNEAELYTIKDLVVIFKEKFNINVTTKDITKYCWKNNIKYKKINGVKYSKEYYNFLKKQAPKHTMKELLKLIKKKFNLDITKEILFCHLRRKKISYKLENANLSHSNNPMKIGSIVIKDGYLAIKTGYHKWEYLHRKIYEDKFGKLPENMNVIFLDGDKSNLDINNLKAISRASLTILNNCELYSNNPELTALGCSIADLKAKINYKMKEGNN